MSSLQKNILMKNLPPLPHRTGNPRGGVGGVKHRKRDYSPLPWSDFFDQSQDVVTSPGNSFRVYVKGSSGPVLLLLHGGGHSSLSWAVFSVAISKLVECEVVAVDLRGHGESCTVDDSDLSADTLVSDVGCIVETLFGGRDSLPPIVLMGHSMGGAIAARVAAKEVLASLLGLLVIDVVEGTAMNSLDSMQSYLKSRPEHFKSLETAIEWSIRSGQLRNAESARVSMAGQVKSTDGVSSNPSGSPSLPSNGKEEERGGNASAPIPPPSSIPSISEEEEGEEREGDISSASVPPPSKDEEGNPSAHLPSPSATISEEGGGPPSPPHFPSSTKEGQKPGGVAIAGGSGRLQDSNQSETATQAPARYVWRVDLKRTECYWHGWFDGLSKVFLSVAVPKMLILAGVDRLDKELTIAQMQGKFWMHVLSGCGHSVHEDAPDKVAEVVAAYLTRHKFAKQKEPNDQDLMAETSAKYISCSPCSKPHH